MKFIGFCATYLCEETDFDKCNTIEIECKRIEVTYRNGQLGLFDKDNKLIATIEPTCYPDEPYRIIYPNDTDCVNEDDFRRLFYKFEIVETI